MSGSSGSSRGMSVKLPTASITRAKVCATRRGRDSVLRPCRGVFAARCRRGARLITSGCPTRRRAGPAEGRWGHRIARRR